MKSRLGAKMTETIKQFEKIGSFSDGVILARGNERILRLPGLKDVEYQFADIGKMVRREPIDYTEFEDCRTNTLLGC